MRVAQIIDSLNFGGAQTWQVILAQAMREHDIALTVLSLKNNNQTTTTPDELESLGAQVLFYPSKHLLNPSRLWQITRFLRRERFDIVQTHLHYANIVGTLAARLAGIPVIASLQNSRRDEARFYHPIRYRLETWVLRHLAHRVMAVGYATAEANQARLRGKHIEAIPTATVIIQPIPVAERAAIRTEIIGDPSRPLLISVGRLAEQKAYNDLITAFADLHQKHPSAALVIAGGGHLYHELKTQIATLGLEGHAVLLGQRKDVPRLLAASDIFVSSSLFEGLPVAVLEAMAAGLPIVATSVSDVPRVVVNGTGLLVPPQEPLQLSQAVGSLLDNPTQMQAFGAAAQAHIARNHSPARWARQVLELYKSVQKSPLNHLEKILTD